MKTPKKMKKRRTVLVVEDEEALLEAIKTKMNLHNFSVKTAKSFDEAVEYINKGEDIDAVWLDHYLLGKQNGMDFAHTLRNKREKYN